MVNANRVRQCGIIASIGGFLWLIAPLPVRAIQTRSSNGFFAVVALLLIVGLLGIQIRHELGWISNLGYFVTVAALGTTIVGAIIEVVFTPSRLFEMGLGGGRIFITGLNLTVVAAPILGVGLWYETSARRTGPALLILTVPIVLFVTSQLVRIGFGQYNWVPFTAPYGAAWIALGYHLWTDTPGVDRMESRENGDGRA